MNNESNNEYTNNNNINESKNNFLVIVIVLIIIVLAVLSLCLYFYMKQNDVNNKDNENKEGNYVNENSEILLDEYYLKTTDIIDEYIIKYKYSAVANNEISYSDFRKNNIVKNIVDNYKEVNNVGCNDDNCVSHIDDITDKDGVEYPSYCEKNSYCVENIAKDFGLTVSEISKMDKDVWNKVGGQYCIYMYDANEIKNKYQDIYNEIFNTSFSINLSSNIYGIGYIYSYDSNLNKIIVSKQGGTFGFYERVIIDSKEENNLYVVRFVEGYFTSGGKWMSLDIDSSEDISSANEASEVVKRNKNRLPNYEIVFEKTSNGYKFKNIEKVS